MCSVPPTSLVRGATVDAQPSAGVHVLAWAGPPRLPPRSHARLCNIEDGQTTSFFRSFISYSCTSSNFPQPISLSLSLSSTCQQSKEERWFRVSLEPRRAASAKSPLIRNHWYKIRPEAFATDSSLPMLPFQSSAHPCKVDTPAKPSRCASGAYVCSS